MGILKTDSYRKSIIFSSGFNLLAKLAGFANSMAIAYYFGTQAKTDIYFYSIATIAMLMGLVTSLDHSVIVPEAMRLREQEGEKKSRDFFNFFLFIFLFIGLATVLVLYINPIRFFTAISKFDQSALLANIEQIYAVIPLCVLMLFSNFLIDLFASYKFFTLPMIIALINSATSLVFIIVFHNIWDVTSMVIAQIFSYGINIFLLLWLLRKKLNWHFSFKKIRIRKNIWKNIFYSQTANVFSLLGGYAPMFLLSGFSAGVITCLNYGRNISEIPRQLIVSQFSIVSGIKLNEIYASGNLEQLNFFFLKTSKFLIFILMPVSGLLFLFAEEIVTILYQRGNFSNESVLKSAMFLRYLGLLLPLYGIDTMFARLNMAGQKIKNAFYYQIISNFITILLTFFFIRYIGEIGYPIALITCYFAGIFIVYYIIHKLYPAIRYFEIIKYFFLILLINILIGLLSYLIITHITLPFIARLFLGGTIYSFLLITINQYLHLNEDFASLISWNKLSNIINKKN